MATSAPAATPVVRRQPVERVAAVPAWVILAGLVTLGAAVRVATGLAHTTPRFFPDEYIYAELGRSISTGSLSIRGHAADFPALLEPLLAAPLWRLGGDVELGYRLVQGMHAVAISLTAVPVYVVARRLGITERLALACAALTLAMPAMVFSSYVTADAVALPLALGAVAAATAALERPTRHAQGGFLALAALATFARVQYVVLFAAFLAAALVVSRGSVRRVVHDYRTTVLAVAVAAVGVLLVGAGRALGYYRGVVDLGVDPVAVGRWAGTDLMLIVYAAGVVLVPGAIVGLALTVARPRTHAERCFGAFVAAFAALILFEGAVYASNGAERFQERYLVSLLPLVPVLFCVAARRLDERGVRVATALLAAGAFVLAAVLPLSEYTVLEAKQDSPFLHAVYHLEQIAGTGNAALIVGVLAGALAVVAALAVYRPRLGVPAALAVGFTALVVTSLGATAYDLDVSPRIHRTFIATDDPQWVDHADLGSVSVLQTPNTQRQQVSAQLFWNASLDEVLLLPGAAGVDAYGSRSARIADDGRIVVDGEVQRGPLLVEEYASWAQLEDAELLQRTVSSALWRPVGTPRISLLLAGRYLDGWLSARARLTVWPTTGGRRSAVVSMRLSLPEGAPAVTLDVGGDGATQMVTVEPGAPSVLRIPIDTIRPVTVTLRPRRPLLADGARVVSVLASAPRIVDTSKGA